MKEFNHAELYKLDGDVPLLRSIPYGVQHILAMFVANLAPIFIVAAAAGIDDATTGSLVQSAMLIAGIGTLIQLFPVWRLGSGLPIVMGISFTFVTVLCGVAATYGYNAAIGAIIVGGIIEGVLGLFAKYWRRIISPIVAAVVVTSIGFSLLNVGATSFGGGSGAPDFGSPTNIALGTIALVSCLAFQILAKGKTKQLSVLFGLVVGYVAALVMGAVDLSGFADAKPLALPQFMPFAPEFEPSAIIAVTLIFLVSATETIGDTSAISMVGLSRDVREKELSGSIACDGFVSSLSACFGCLPITSFSQNVGLVAMTKVVNRRAIATGAAIMIAAGFLPIIGVVFSSLPEAVLGGCTIMMFGNIIVSGFQMIARAGFTQRNILIAALSLSIGIGFTQVSDIFVLLPEMLQNVFADNCVAVVFLVAVVANLALPKTISIDGAELAGEAEQKRADAAADRADAAAEQAKHQGEDSSLCVKDASGDASRI
ncbi:MAG: purine permease [Slackia piriformis]|uniref:Purine permease n=1 Tax=Slackia piriformis TaxID=626934 RepID=A0A943UZ89_9ACTN|nr:purine permease [Slackia piriformis]